MKFSRQQKEQSLKFWRRSVVMCSKKKPYSSLFRIKTSYLLWLMLPAALLVMSI